MCFFIIPGPFVVLTRDNGFNVYVGTYPRPHTRVSSLTFAHKNIRLTDVRFGIHGSQSLPIRSIPDPQLYIHVGNV